MVCWCAKLSLYQTSRPDDLVVHSHCSLRSLFFASGHGSWCGSAVVAHSAQASPFAAICDAFLLVTVAESGYLSYLRLPVSFLSRFWSFLSDLLHQNSHVCLGVFCFSHHSGHLSPTTMPWLQSQRFSPPILMFDVRINPSSWPGSA